MSCDLVKRVEVLEKQILNIEAMEKNIPIAYFNLFCKDEEARAMARQEVIDDADKKHKLDIPTESQIQNKLTRIWLELANEINDKYKSHMFSTFSKFFPEEEECEEECEEEECEEEE